MPEVRLFVIASAQPRMITPKDGRPSFNLLEVFDDQGNVWVARQDVFNLAQQWRGQRVQALVRVETNDRGYTNKFLDSIELAGAQPPGGYQPVQQAQQAQVPQQPFTPVIAQPFTPVSAPNEKERQTSIHRQTAAKVAAELSDTPAEFFENVQMIFQWFETGQVPAWTQPQMPQAQPQRQNVGAYQQYNPDPGPQPDQYASVADDDIPF